MPYQVGDVVRLPVTFSVGTPPVLTDPTAVTLTVRAPDGTTTIHPSWPPNGVVIKDQTGTFHADVTAGAAGLWTWKWVGTGTAAGVDEGTFTVDATLLGPGQLCSVGDVRLQGETPSTTTTPDDLVQTFITAASSVIPNRYQREFAPVGTAARMFRVDGSLVDLAPFDLRSATTVTLHPEQASPSVIAASGYALLPLNGSLGGTYLYLRLGASVGLPSSFADEFGFAQLEVVGTWGMAAVPADVSRAAALTVSSWLDRAIAEYGIQGLDDGQSLRPDPPRGWPIPFAAHQILRPYERVVV